MIEVTGDSFDMEVSKSDQPVIVDFYGESCNPCKTQGIFLEELQWDWTGKVKVVKMNASDARIAAKFDIMGVPTLIFFKNGQEIYRTMGLQRKEDLVKRVRILFGV